MVQSLQIRVALRLRCILASATKVEVPHASVVAQLVFSLPMVTHPSISIENQKMIDRLLRYVLPRFSSAPGKYYYELLIACKYRLHNFGLVKTHGIDYTTFQLDLEARH